jgi:hypothetical protein
VGIMSKGSRERLDRSHQLDISSQIKGLIRGA